MRVTFLVDGFNVFHSIKDAVRFRENPYTSLKWLDLLSMMRSCLPLVGPSAKLEEVHFFTAYAHYLNDNPLIVRHGAYVAALEATGVIVHEGRFKEKPQWCRLCEGEFMRPEEKETDVAIAVCMLELFATDRADNVVLVSGDSDLIPAVRCARRLYPKKKVTVAFPFARGNDEIKPLAHKHFRLKAKRYARHQLPNPTPHPSGRSISKPESW